ncbi:MAG: thiamine phosphate synthase [Acidocella sp.]|nr:thiamine phosphate synthase [Acidocella sp.]
MDQALIARARRVKCRQPPFLWLFTDAARCADLPGLIGILPPGLCGVVLRDDTHPHRAAYGRRIAQICRARRIALVVAGDGRLASGLGAGLHLRGGAYPDRCRIPARWLRTASAHNMADVIRARRAGVALIFISPVFATNSHPGAPVLGPLGYLALARHAGPAKPCALGGITGKTIRRLGKFCLGAGAIDAFLGSKSTSKM